MRADQALRSLRAQQLGLRQGEAAGAPREAVRRRGRQIKVLARATESEMKEKKARVEDALHATRAAVEEGILPGGGTALVQLSAGIDKLKVEGDEKLGLDISRRPCGCPAVRSRPTPASTASIILNDVLEAKAVRPGLRRGQGQDDRPGEGRHHRTPPRSRARRCRTRARSRRCCSRPTRSWPRSRRRSRPRPVAIRAWTACSSRPLRGGAGVRTACRSRPSCVRRASGAGEARRPASTSGRCYRPDAPPASPSRLGLGRRETGLSWPVTRTPRGPVVTAPPDRLNGLCGARRWVFVISVRVPTTAPKTDTHGAAHRESVARPDPPPRTLDAPPDPRRARPDRRRQQRRDGHDTAVDPTPVATPSRSPPRPRRPPPPASPARSPSRARCPSAPPSTCRPTATCVDGAPDGVLSFGILRDGTAAWPTSSSSSPTVCRTRSTRPPRARDPRPARL